MSAKLIGHPSEASRAESESPRLGAFARLSMGKAVMILALGAAAMAAAGPGWGDRVTARWEELQDQAIESGYFSGKAKVDAAWIDLRGDHALINPKYHSKPEVVAERMFSGLGDALDPLHWEWDRELKSQMTFYHERAHVEYQTGMPMRFDAPGLSPQDRERFEKTFAANDAGAFEAMRTRLHGAMHERFAEAYGALVMAKMAQGSPEKAKRVDEFFKRRVEDRSSDLTGQAKTEFAHLLGRDMKAAWEVSRMEGFKELSPNQMRAVALRIASLSYLADAKGDEKLAPIISQLLQGPASQAMWSRMGEWSAERIASRAMENLPEPEAVKKDDRALESNDFASRLASSREQMQYPGGAPKARPALR